MCSPPPPGRAERWGLVFSPEIRAGLGHSTFRWEHDPVERAHETTLRSIRMGLHLGATAAFGPRLFIGAWGVGRRRFLAIMSATAVTVFPSVYSATFRHFEQPSASATTARSLPFMGKVISYRRAVSDGEPPYELEDKALVAAMGTGDLQALGGLYDRFHRDVYAFVHRAITSDDTHLDDLVQDTFLAAFHAAARFRGRSSVKTWLFGIAINTGRNFIRSETRRRKAHEHYPLPVPCSPHPDDAFQSTRELSRVAEAIAGLPYKLRVAYVTCVLEGVGSDEAAVALRVRKGTLWRRVHDARNRIREAIGRSKP